MRRRILFGLAAGVAFLLALVEIERALLGALRFFLLSGARVGDLRRRRDWFEGTLLGRRMGLRDLLRFGSWHAETLSPPWDR